MLYTRLPLVKGPDEIWHTVTALRAAQDEICFLLEFFAVFMVHFDGQHLLKCSLRGHLYRLGTKPMLSRVCWKAQLLLVRGKEHHCVLVASFANFKD
eukprot:1969407-Amphidinium_carterae.1